MDMPRQGHFRCAEWGCPRGRNAAEQHLQRVGSQPIPPPSQARHGAATPPRPSQKGDRSRSPMGQRPVEARIFAPPPPSRVLGPAAADIVMEEQGAGAHAGDLQPQEEDEEIEIERLEALILEQQGFINCLRSGPKANASVRAAAAKATQDLEALRTQRALHRPIEDQLTAAKRKLAVNAKLLDDKAAKHTRLGEEMAALHLEHTALSSDVEKLQQEYDREAAVAAAADTDTHFVAADLAKPDVLKRILATLAHGNKDALITTFQSILGELQDHVNSGNAETVRNLCKPILGFLDGDPLDGELEADDATMYQTPVATPRGGSLGAIKVENQQTTNEGAQHFSITTSPAVISITSSPADVSFSADGPFGSSPKPEAPRVGNHNKVTGTYIQATKTWHPLPEPEQPPCSPRRGRSPRRASANGPYSRLEDETQRDQETPRISAPQPQQHQTGTAEAWQAGMLRDNAPDVFDLRTQDAQPAVEGPEQQGVAAVTTDSYPDAASTCSGNRQLADELDDEAWQAGMMRSRPATASPARRSGDTAGAQSGRRGSSPASFGEAAQAAQEEAEAGTEGAQAEAETKAEIEL